VQQTGIKYSAVDKAMATMRATPATLTYALKARGDESNIAWFGGVDLRPHEKELAMTIEIKRGGESTGYWSEDGWDVEVLHNTPGKNIEIRFSIASKGGGTTNVIVCVNSDSFGQITNAMMKADTDRATKAFESAMRAGH
jgi:hypothetical protein